MEARLLPEIDAAERRALPRFISPLVAEGAWGRRPGAVGALVHRAEAGGDLDAHGDPAHVVQAGPLGVRPELGGDHLTAVTFRGGRGALSNLSVLRHPSGDCPLEGFVYSDCALGCPIAVTEELSSLPWDGVNA